jgi:hypothetical protein
MKLLFTLSALVFFQISFAQKHTLSGYIKDGSNGEELIGAALYIPELSTGVTTNLYGFYSISLPAGTYDVVFSFVGFNTQKRTIELSTSQTLNIELNSTNVELSEFEVSSEREDQNITSVEMSVEKLEIKTIRKIPQFMGEVDIIRSLQLLPGVSTVGEGAMGFNVRGGNIDQNLILLDEAPVFNSSHLFGFFSVFNADAVKDFKLYKGGIPAKYGGRLSSVLDVRQIEGNTKEFHGSAGIGLISSRLMLEGPIAKDKASFMIAGRRSYIDLFFPLFEDLEGNKFYFYDLNAKINYKIGERDRLFLSGYFGDDVFVFGDAFKARWGNGSGSLRWNHLFNDKLFANTTLIYSNYNYSLGVPTGVQAFNWQSTIQNYNVKADFSYFLNPSNTIEFGVNALFYTFDPGSAKGTSDESIFNEVGVERKRGFEPAIYVSNEQKFGDKFTVQYGLRYSMFVNYGPQTVYQYENGIPDSRDNIIDTLTYGKGEIIKTYSGLEGFEPRLAMNFTMDSRNAFKASYNRTRQYIHLISNTTAATPIDVWAPADSYIKPSTVDQIAVGYFRNFSENTYNFSVEGFYKWYYDVLDYRDGAELLINPQLETQLLSGDGLAYGLEFMLKKVKGKFTGWLSYTLSRSERTVNGINKNEAFPTNWDKTHDFSAVASYDINDKWNISANFAYMTGRPITYPDGRYEFDGIIVPNYSNRNGARTPDYHRLDFSATYTKPKDKGKKVFFVFKKPKDWHSVWVFSVYNVYNRKNPYSVFFRQNEDNPQVTEAVQLSIFGSVIPAVTYNFKF